MEGNRRKRDLPVRRGFEGNRLEEEIWAVAYEEVWPVLWRALGQNQLERSQRDELAARDDAVTLRVGATSRFLHCSLLARMERRPCSGEMAIRFR
jgi:hypothetical protein